MAAGGQLLHAARCCRDDIATLASSPCSTPALALSMQPLQTTSLIPLLSTMPTCMLRPQEHVAKKREAGGLMADEMSLLEFVDFVLAWDCRANPATIPYFFAIFDLQKQVRQRSSPHILAQASYVARSMGDCRHKGHSACCCLC